MRVRKTNRRRSARRAKVTIPVVMAEPDVYVNDTTRGNRDKVNTNVFDQQSRSAVALTDVRSEPHRALRTEPRPEPLQTSHLHVAHVDNTAAGPHSHAHQTCKTAEDNRTPDAVHSDLPMMSQEQEQNVPMMSQEQNVPMVSQEQKDDVLSSENGYSDGTRARSEDNVRTSDSSSELSPKDVAGLQELAKVEAMLDSARRDLQIVPSQILHHCTRLCAALWKAHSGLAAPSAAWCKSAHMAVNSLAYRSGVKGEDVLRLIFRLDGVSGSDAVRCERKRLVQRANAVISFADRMRSRAQKLFPLLDTLQQRVQQSSPPTSATPATPITDGTQSKDPSSSVPLNIADSASVTSSTSMDQSSSSSSSSSLSSSSPHRRKHEVLIEKIKEQCPRIAVRFKFSTSRDVRRLVVHIPGVVTELCRCSKNTQASTLTVFGVATGSQYEWQFGCDTVWFEETIKVPALSECTTSIDADDRVLVVSIAPPRRPAARQPAQQPRQRPAYVTRPRDPFDPVYPPFSSFMPQSLIF